MPFLYPQTPESPIAPPPEGVGSLSASSDLQPSVPKDFQIFINLVDLCRCVCCVHAPEIIPKLCIELYMYMPPTPPSHTHLLPPHTHTHTHSRTTLPKVQLVMFDRWVYTFGREVIVQSSRRPLVSGFYKLLATCLKICKLTGYFKVGRTSECLSV